MNFFNTVILIIFVFQFIFIIAVVFFEDKNPVTTLSWVLVLTFLPLVGFVIYMFFGRKLTFFVNRKLRRVKGSQALIKEKMPNSQKVFKQTSDIVTGQTFSFSDPDSEKYKNFINLAYDLCLTPYSQNNDVKIYIDAKDKYRDLFKDIENAKSHIHMVYFIISDTDVSHRLIDLLSQKASQGVEIRLIYDELGNFVVPKKMFRKITESGGNVYKFFPLTFTSILHANHRNHHKIVVIDGQIGYTGGMNIGDEYMGLHPVKTPWRDTHMRLTGDIVYSLQSAFIKDLLYINSGGININSFMNLKYYPDAIENNDIGVQLVLSGPENDMQAIKRILATMIATARKTVYIQTPYFMPDSVIIEALQNASKSGVEVILMIPGIPDKKIAYMVTYSFLHNMLDFGVKVYIYPGFLHSKMLTIDNEFATIGTTNLDTRSLSLHFEDNVLIYNKEIARQSSRIFRQDLAISKELTIDDYKKRSNIKKFMEKIFRLLAPLM